MGAEKMIRAAWATHGRKPIESSGREAAEIEEREVSKLTRIVVDEAIAAMVARPGTFRISEYTLDDTKAGLEYWIANTVFDAGVYRPFKMKFGLWQSVRFHRAVRALKAYQAVAFIRASQ